ncbi:MAG TPA: sigma-70 family RNA polymerase sigma factor [Acidimicrobiia bacterium]
MTLDHDDARLEQVEQIEQLEVYRRELTAYSYRMLGSAFEADDAVQETMVRAWRAIGSFEGRSSLRSWLYRIATNVCFDMLRSSQRRARPMDLGPASTTDAFDGAQLSENAWLTPIPAGDVLDTPDDPAEVIVERETVRLAFVNALQHLPARQRAVLILREVLRWQATEVAELLDTSVASVNSALQRARATLADADIDELSGGTVSPDQQELLGRFVDAFERYDIPALVALLRNDVVMSMPPYTLWLNDSDEVARWMVGPGNACRGSRLFPVDANGEPAFAQYKPDPAGGYAPWSIIVLELDGGAISGTHYFLDLDTRLFARFGLPTHID